LGKRARICAVFYFLLISCGHLIAQTGPVSPIPFDDVQKAVVLSRPSSREIVVPGFLKKRSPFPDSFKEKASKNPITKKIYDLVVVPVDTVPQEVHNVGSDAAYRQYSGRRIRNIVVRRLNVFGADVDNPDLYKSGKGQKFLNSTHANTRERIIRKYLLFTEGDTLSPVSLSDNERILRDLSFIYDARIKVLPVSDKEADILIVTKDVYSLGGDYSPSGLKKGSVSAFESNLFGTGHEFGIAIPYDNSSTDSPGFMAHYLVDNIASTFVNLNIFYKDGIGNKSYGVDMERKFLSHTTKYAGGISIHNVWEDVDKDAFRKPEHFNVQDYWLARSFLLNREFLTRLIIGARFTNNNVFQRPDILPDSYYSLQNYRLLLGSVTLSTGRYFKANLVHGYGRSEDIPYGGMMKVTIGKENNEFKKRSYAGSEISFGYSFPDFGYMYGSAGLGAFINGQSTEQGIMSVKLKYFSNLIPVGRSMIRNFIRFDYTRGFDRNTDEHLSYFNDNGFSGIRNDSVQGEQRITLNFESVLFSPVNIYGFRFAFFGFADFSTLAGTNQIIANGTPLSGFGIGIRVRNDNLIFKTFQIRLGFFPDHPYFSRINNIVFSGEEPSRFENFDPGPPLMVPYR
jgi:hypothetical protein